MTDNNFMTTFTRTCTFLRKKKHELKGLLIQSSSGCKDTTELTLRVYLTFAVLLCLKLLICKNQQQTNKPKTVY